MIDFVPSTTPDPIDEGEARRARLERLDDAIAKLSAHLQAATWRLLALVRAFDAEEGWADQGFTSCAQWLSWRTGIRPGAAREKVRVARALADLPALSAAMKKGELSYSLARAITRVATPENEAELVATARHVSAAQMERLVRHWRRSERTEAEELRAEAERHAARELQLTACADGSWKIRGRLDPEAGTALQQALAAAEEALYRAARLEEEGDAEAGTGDEDRPPAAARRADALGLVAEAALGEGLAREAEEAPVTGRAGRYEVVVHVSAETLAGTDDEGGGVSAERPKGAGSVPAETPAGMTLHGVRATFPRKRLAGPG